MKSLWIFVVMVASASSVRSPHGLPFPYKEDLAFLTSEEEERLIYGRDMSVINEKIKDIPEQIVVAPPSPDGSLPIPTMDPPLPPLTRKKRPRKKSNRGFPFKVPRALSMLSRITAPLKRKPRMRSKVPVPTYRSRPSTLVSSEPDQLEMAFKRIEIMASRAGLNMSSMPRTTQMEVVKRLVPKLPPKMSSIVRNALDSNSEKMYHYLPEPMKDPAPAPDFSSYYIKDDVYDDFGNAPVSHHHGSHSFDAGKVSLTMSNDEGYGSEFDHSTSFTGSYEHSPSSGLLPPTEVHDHHDSYHSHQNYDSVGQYSHSREIKMKDSSGLPAVASPLVSEFHGSMEAQESHPAPVIISPGSSRNSKTVKISSFKTVTPSPIRLALPKNGKITTTRRPIRVSIISKDAINTNQTETEPVMKVVHLEPISENEDEGKGIPAHVVELKVDPPSTTEATTKSPPPSRVKEISTDIIEEEEAKHKKQRRPHPYSTITRTTTTIPPPELDKLDMYEDWTEDSEGEWDDEWGDPYDLTDEEIAATVAELKRYEEQGFFDNSLEQEFPWQLGPHPLEYPDHPDHPKDSFEEVKGDGAAVEKEKVQSPKAPSPGPPMKRRPPFRPMRRPPFGMRRRPPMRRRFPPKRRPPYMRRRPRPPPRHRPVTINEVTVSEIPKEYNKECDFFSEELCLVVQDYPIEAISEAMDNHPDASSLLVKEPEMKSWVEGNSKSREFKSYFRRSEEEMAHQQHDFAGEGGFLCSSKVAYGQVKKAKSSSTGNWKYVVNYGDNTQTLRLEKCLSPGNTCSYVMPHYQTACTQVYNYHRLLAWDSEKGLHVDVFKVPTCCTCHVQGYYMPHKQHGFTPARRRERPPRLNFPPPRGRGAKKVPSVPPPAQPLHKPTPAPAPVSKSTQAPTHSSVSKRLKDDLQDLLAQYSALREKIAKKKNEKILVSYSVSVSKGKDSLTPKTRESRTSQYPSRKLLLKLKKLTDNMKQLNTTGKAKMKIKRPLVRALLLARLKKKLKSAKSRALRGRSMKLRSESTSLSKPELQKKLQLLRMRLNKYNERRKRIPSGSKRLRNTSNQRPERKKGTNSKQRLRLGDSRPSKVNYSYHPIMDYFKSRSVKLKNSE